MFVTTGELNPIAPFADGSTRGSGNPVVSVYRGGFSPGVGTAQSQGNYRTFYRIPNRVSGRAASPEDVRL